MTEAEWLTATNPTMMIEFIRDLTSERKLLLLVLACCRRIEHLLPNDECKAVLTAMESHIEGQCSAEELRAARYEAGVKPKQMISAASKNAYATVVMRRHSYQETEEIITERQQKGTQLAL
jgi:hypothetical protein